MSSTPLKTNLLSFIQAQNSLSVDGFEKFKNHHNINIKADEIEDLEKLVSSLIAAGSTAIDFEDFYLGYTIPQIGKEFDLLRFGTNFIVNIELKRSSAEEKIFSQLHRNNYYLKFCNKEVHHLTFVSETRELYLLKNCEKLEQIEIDYLGELLQKQKFNNNENVNTFFNPSDYLVSPLNSTERFLEGEYFFTQQQEDIKDQILKKINQPKETNFISLTGSAGTGKTLLAYDIVKSILANDQKVLVFHCGILNEGHHKLIESGWELKPIKDYDDDKSSTYNLILVDEAQRLNKSQVDYFSKQKNSNSYLFSYDQSQTLATFEDATKVCTLIKDLCEENSHKLSEKIRTNKEISNFIKSLFNNQKNMKDDNYRKENISIRYFNSINDASYFLDRLDKNYWKTIRFTPSRYNKEFHEEYSDINSNTSHEVIGQEFDGVTVIIDEHFTYDEKGELKYKANTYYSVKKMLFQNVTRAKKRLLIIIINNQELLERCLSIT